MFNPALGTFINLDPLESGSNFYAYCGDAPTDGTDPSGFAQSPPVQGHTADLTQATNPSALRATRPCSSLVISCLRTLLTITGRKLDQFKVPMRSSTS